MPERLEHFETSKVAWRICSWSRAEVVDMNLLTGSSPLPSEGSKPTMFSLLHKITTRSMRKRQSHNCQHARSGFVSRQAVHALHRCPYDKGVQSKHETFHRVGCGGQLCIPRQAKRHSQFHVHPFSLQNRHSCPPHHGRGIMSPSPVARAFSEFGLSSAPRPRC